MSGATVILGAGLAGLSAGHHLKGRGPLLILEEKPHAGGHVFSRVRDGFTWDEGPHVSFTRSEYVRSLFARNADEEVLEYPVVAGNWFGGAWVEHPAQCFLHQIAEPLRSRALESFLQRRQACREDRPPGNYEEWLREAFGDVFAEHFPLVYTEKYWTVPARELGTDWIGKRVYYPKKEDVVAGSRGPLPEKKHYITKVRYPRRGGYWSFARRMADGLEIRHGARVARVDLRDRRVVCADGQQFSYRRLVNTLPLPDFLQACGSLPPAVEEARRALSCSRLLLVNVAAPHPTRRPENWIYVYDREMASTRINCTEKLSPHNAPEGTTGVQVEVYDSRHRPAEASDAAMGEKVLAEVRAMGLIDREAKATFHTHRVEWANVIFHHATRGALGTLWGWLEEHGLTRSPQDTDPMTDWERAEREGPGRAGTLEMAGRFAEWKYHWTDDCVLRGRQIGEAK
jgi:protoporphyrinogen oxidase